MNIAIVLTVLLAISVGYLIRFYLIIQTLEIDADYYKNTSDLRQKRITELENDKVA